MNQMKKILIITIIFYMFLITFSFASTATIDATAARLREEASTNSNVLTKIYKGEEVEILEKQGEWYKVKYEKNVGYLKNNLIKEGESNNTSEKTDNQNENVNKQEENESLKIIAKSNTNIRFQPSMMSNSILVIDIDKELTKISQIGNWIKVSDGVITGWILENRVNTIEESVVNYEDSKELNSAKSEENDEVTENEKNIEQEEILESNENKTITNKKGIVNVETAKVRETANPSAKILGFLDYNDEITIIAEEGEWYRFTEKNISGFVHKSLINVEESVSSRGTIEERKNEENNKTISQTLNNEDKELVSENTEVSVSNGKKVTELAKQYLGYKYVVGGKTPESGFDCSGFTRYIFLQFGYNLGATAAGQNNIGIEVNRENLQAGDLILFYDEAKTKIGHTGIYVSDGEFIHSANPQRGVVLDNLNTSTYYSERFIIAKRIVE